MATQYEVQNNPDESRFEAIVEGQTAFAEYAMEPGSIRFTHTEVPVALEGRGLAAAIVKSALEHAREKNLKVIPQCAYVASYIEKHPEYRELVA